MAKKNQPAVYFVGSERSGPAPSPAFKALGRDLGHLAAERGMSIIIDSKSPRTLDLYVFQGAARFCKQHPERRCSVKFHRRPEPESSVPFAPPRAPDNLQIRVTTHGAPPSQARLGARAAAVAAANAVVLVGGGRPARSSRKPSTPLDLRAGTYAAYTIARHAGKLILPVARFGGDASAVYKELRANLGNTAQRVLNRPRSKVAASEILDLVAEGFREHSKAHSYFISYARSPNGNAIEADHIEALLLRNQRIVYRDESNLEFNELLQDALRDLIAHSDTFVAIQSSEYAKRAWCKWELKMAQKLPKSPKRRVVQLFVQDAPRGARSHADGRTRAKRALTVEKMLKQE